MQLLKLMFWITVSVHAALAQPGGPHHTQAKLVSDAKMIVAGEPFQLGIHLTMNDHWHTYWENPGSSGLPTKVTWETVEGLTIEALQFPAPKQFVDDAGFVTFGYDEEALLIADAVYNGSETQLKIAGVVNWLECLEQCIPGSADVTLSLSVGSSVEPDQQALFKRFEKRVPLPADRIEFKYEASLDIGADRWAATLELSQLPENNKKPQVFPTGNYSEYAEFTEANITQSDAGWQIALGFDAYDPPNMDTLNLEAVVGISNGTETSFYRLPLHSNAAPSQAVIADAKQADSPTVMGQPAGDSSLWFILLLAFGGGMILNLMPCVLPVLSLKIMSLVEESGGSALHRQAYAWVYTLGIMISFLVFSLVFVSAKAAGTDLGIGFQFQNPGFVVAMSAVVFVLGLSFFGVYTISAPSGTALDNLAQKRGVMGAFFQGALMTLLSTPCTAPGLGFAYFAALSASTFEIIIIFQAVALGLAAPYLVLAYSPFLMKFIPKPGAWMHHFKVAMGFLLMGTLVWLFDILASLTGPAGVTGTMALMVALGCAAYIYGQSTYAPTATKLKAFLMALVVAGCGYWLGMHSLFDIQNPSAELDLARENIKLAVLAEQEGADSTDVFKILESRKTTAEHIDWIPFSPATVSYFRDKNRMVFLDFTAEWCATCKVNEKLFIDTSEVRAAFAASDVVTIKVDYTNRDDSITQLLNKFDRAGVPLYVIYPGNGDPVVLPEAITKGIVIDGLNRAKAAMELRSSL